MDIINNGDGTFALALTYDEAVRLVAFIVKPHGQPDDEYDDGDDYCPDCNYNEHNDDGYGSAYNYPFLDDNDNIPCGYGRPAPCACCTE